MYVIDTPPLTPSAEDAGDERGEGSSTETGSEGEGAAMSVSKLNIQPYPSHEGGEEGHYDPNRLAVDSIIHAQFCETCLNFLCICLFVNILCVYQIQASLST